MGGFPSNKPSSFDSRNFIGIEIEMFMWPSQEVYNAEYIAYNTAMSAWYRHQQGPAPKPIETVKYEAMDAEFKKGNFSKEIQVQFQEGEICCLVDERFYRPVLKEMLDVRRRLGHSNPNSMQYGMHVHIDVRNRDGHKVCNAMARDWDLYAKFRDADRARSTGYGSRNNALNIYREGYRTVEVRTLQATLDYDLCCQYIDTLLRIANAVPLPQQVAAPEPMLQAA